MKHRSLNKVLIVSVLGLILAACGGGGGSGGGNILTGGSAPGVSGEVTLTITLLDASGTPTDTVNGDDQGTVRAVLEDGQGNAIPQTIVTFSSTVGILAGNKSALTNASGIAVIAITAGTVEGAGQITAEATVSDITVRSNSLGMNSDGNGPIDDPSRFATTLTLVPESISRGNPGTGTLTVEDPNGALIAGATVQFSVDRGVMEPVSGAVFTDTNGVATVLVKAGTTEGTGFLSASVSVDNDTFEATPVGFLTAGDAFATLTLDVSTATGGSGALTAEDTVTADNPATITALVIDSEGDPVVGTIVTFVLSESIGYLANDQDITNASGIASVVLSAGNVPGFGTVSATTVVDGQSVSNEPADNIVFETAGDEPIEGEGSPNLAITLSLLDAQGVDIDPPNLDADTPGILKAVITDVGGNPVPDVVVKFEAELGDLFPTSGLALTNALGEASVALNAGSVPGAGTAKATILIDGQSFDFDSLTFETLGNAGDTEVILTLSIDDATPGNESNIITVSEPGVLNVRVDDSSGSPLPNRKVTMTTSLGSLASGGATGATVIGTSNASGGVTAQVIAGTTLGTGNIIVTAGDTTAGIQFEVGVDGLQIGRFVGSVFTPGELDIDDTILKAGATTTVSVTVVDQNENVIPNIEIQFSSNCSLVDDPDTGEPLALVSQTGTSNDSGIATATYQANGCVGSDVVRAIESSSGESATTLVEVEQSVTGSIRFDSVVIDPANPGLTSIQIKESGGIETALIIFQVLDVLGDPVADKRVTFELTTNIGGLNLVNLFGLTDIDGKATATVTAGFIPTTVRVRASVDVDTDDDGVNDTTLVTLSGILTVNTGIPDQNSLSVSTSTFNLEGDGLDGLTTPINVRMSDFFNNPVPDGTAVSVTTELGRVVSQCTTADGGCVVTFNTQEPRSPLDPDKPFKNLVDDQCPAERLLDEPVTVVGIVNGNTAYKLDTSASVVVQTAGNVYLTEGVAADFTVDTDGTGITCVAASPCTHLGNQPLKVTYTRLWLDEDFDDVNDGDTDHLISNPGIATGPFVARTGVPCRAGSREVTEEASAYFGGLGQPYGGRSTVLIRAQGEESFVDTNGNGQYDYNEPFADLTEAFLDTNEDLVFGNGTPGIDDSRDQATPECYGPVAPVTDPSSPTDKCFQEGGEEETFMDFDSNGTFDEGNQIYNGSLCPKAISDRTTICAAAPCDEATERYCTREPVDIRRSMTLIMSGSTAFMSVRDAFNGEFVSAVDLDLAFGTYTALIDITANDGSTIPAGAIFTIGDEVGAGVPPFQIAPPGTGETVSLTTGTNSVVVDMADIYNGVLPAGSSIAYNEGTNGCAIQNTPISIVPNTSGFGFTQAVISLGVPDPALVGGSSAPVTVTVTTPDGAAQSAISFSCSYP